MKKILFAIFTSTLLTFYLVGSIIYLITDAEINNTVLTLFIFAICFSSISLKDYMTEKKYFSRNLILIGTFIIIFIIIYCSLTLNFFGTYVGLIEPSILFYELLIITITPLVLTLWYLEIQLFNLNYKSITISDQRNDRKESIDITLLSDSQNKELSLDVQELLLVEAQDNYCKIYYLENKEVKKAMFRLSLKKMYDQLSHMNNITRCHRSYIINKSKVNKITGGAQNYKLTILGIDKYVPISRSFDIKTIKQVNH
jgi:DNA-binding LytR/AlgR family response regulator